ncbi:helix-turn-helix domain-containing protein [Paeniglutamicibacter sp. NPDC091659]|uniref:helix-turn-helix domain-containing protein n=1 Tax=Paeniglutamicibacter sp. NPDC091659 TaxID=3364389 RepID=UPI00381EC91C
MKLHVTATRDGRFWFLKSDDIENFYTQALNIAEIPIMAKDLAATLTERPESDFDVEISFDTPEVTAHLRETAALAAKAEEPKAESALERRAAALVLRRQGVTVRDIGTVLGVSHQRAQQLVSH